LIQEFFDTPTDLWIYLMTAVRDGGWLKEEHPWDHKAIMYSSLCNSCLIGKWEMSDTIKQWLPFMVGYSKPETRRNKVRNLYVDEEWFESFREAIASSKAHHQMGFQFKNCAHTGKGSCLTSLHYIKHTNTFVLTSRANELPSTIVIDFMLMEELFEDLDVPTPMVLWHPTALKLHRQTTFCQMVYWGCKNLERGVAEHCAKLLDGLVKSKYNRERRVFAQMQRVADEFPEALEEGILSQCSTADELEEYLSKNASGNSLGQSYKHEDSERWIQWITTWKRALHGCGVLD